MSYRTLNLNTWEAFAITYTTIWFSRDLWKMMLRLYLLALLVCIFTLLAVAHPGVQKVSKFTDVSKFLNVVVGLLLGFFLSNALGRWHSCVNGFLELLDAARNLQMQLATLGVPDGAAGALHALLLRGCLAALRTSPVGIQRVSRW